MAKLPDYKERKKILLIGALPPPMHGSNIFFKYFLESELKNDYQLIFLDISDRREDLSNLGKLDFLNIYYGIRNVLQLIFKLIKKKPNLVYLCPSQTLGYLRDGLFILITRMFSKAKCLEHLHGSNFLDFYYKSNIFVKLFIEMTQYLIDNAIVLGDNAKYNFQKWVPEDKIFIVPNGIKDEFENYEKKQNCTLNILFLSNLFQFKGFLTAVEVFGILSKEYESITMTIAGNDGDDIFCDLTKEEIHDKYNLIIEKYRIKDRINYLGAVYGNEKKELYKTADIFIYPTMVDGFPYVLLEAMSASLPIISSRDVGVINEVIIENETGLLTEKQNINQLVNSLKLLLNDSSLRKSMGNKSRERYLKYYTTEKSINKLNSVLQTILS